MEIFLITLSILAVWAIGASLHSVWHEGTHRIPDDPYGRNPYGRNPYGRNPYGRNPYGRNPYGRA